MIDRHLSLVPSGPAPSDLPPLLTSMIDSFDLSLRAARKSGNTRAVYIGAARKFALWMLDTRIGDFAAVDKTVIERYIVWLAETPRDNGKPYADGYVNNQYRALQQFFRWYCEEEDVPNPFARLSPPKVGQKVVPVFDDDVLANLIRSCEKQRDFESRRDAAILRLFASTGLRLSELTYLTIAQVDLTKCTATVKGKGDKERTVKFDLNTAKAIDRYLRMRAEHKFARHPRLWLAIKNRGPMTPNGVRQIVERRGAALGLDINPHMFRHNFSHRWLDAGGAEGDLMELNGWESPAMIRHYGRSARSARARRAYDRVNVMGDL
jgi:site-specific recombinase XerD